MRDIGLAVDVQAMDWATMLKRRNSKEPASNGGWNLLHSYTGGLTVSTPVWSIACTRSSWLLISVRSATSPR